MASTPLWKHQEKAVSTVRQYISAFGKDDSIGSSMIHMPTGTGKTGVIACCSHFLKHVGCVLVLSPRIALRDQLAREVRGRFFTKLGLSDDLPKAVHNVTRTFPSVADADFDQVILTMTIQMLHSMRNRSDENYAVLQDKVSLLIVDEGHYEPALMWREAIRGIATPRVVFTATPFRNDLKLFDVSVDHSFSYTVKEAIEDRTVRSVQFHQRAVADAPTAFVQDVISFYDDQFLDAQQEADPPRAIIRCDSHEDIRRIGQAFQNAGRACVLIHESFSDGDAARPLERHAVPDPDTEHAVFWVHQFKLLEGIDDPRFQLLAIRKEFRNTRALVQQIGRVLRNPARTPGAVGHVLDHSQGRQEELWKDFRRFDDMVADNGMDVADFGGRMLSAIRKAQPDVIYLDGRFRSAFALDEIDPEDELIIPATVNVFRKSAGFDRQALRSHLECDYKQQDRDVRYVPSGGADVFLYLGFRNSPLLRSTSFIECRLGVTIVRECGEYVCCYDSGGGVPAILDDYTEPVPVDELRRLFRKADGSYLTAVSLHNSNLGVRAIRTRAITASRIDDTVPTFDDHSFICRTARGYSSEDNGAVRRYVGFGRGKITDSTVGRVPFDDYLAWLDQVTQVLIDKPEPVGAFVRFALHADPPDDPTPLNILLDLGEVEDEFVTSEADGIEAGQAMVIEDACQDVTDGEFAVQANGKKCAVSVAFCSKTGRYVIDSADLETVYHSTVNGLDRGIVHYLNREQAFRVVPRSHGSFYTLGAFYSPIIRFGKRYDDDQIGLLKILYGSKCVETVGSEKGTVCRLDRSGWDADSVFSIIDSLGVGHGLDALFGNPDTVICDDMGTEAADFIFADSGQSRVAFVHAKCRSKAGTSKYAASPLQEVCGQATKNLKYFSRYVSYDPPKARKWHNNAWKAPSTTQGEVAARIRRYPAGLSTGLKVWQHVQRLIRDPNSTLEVWLVLGRLLSKSELERQLTASNPAPEARQAAYLLFSVMNDVASVGARLRVICSR